MTISRKASHERRYIIMMTELKMIRNDYPITAEDKKYNREITEISELQFNTEYYGEFEPYGCMVEGKLCNEFELAIYNNEDKESCVIMVIEEIENVNKYFDIEEIY